MASIGCPFCTKTGIAFIITGLTLVLLSTVIAFPWLAIIGLAFLLAAYIVPGLVSGQGCHKQGCSNPAHNHGEEESQ
jgi:hypothetical protein